MRLATNQGFLRDPLDVRLADASAVTLILAAWLAGRIPVESVADGRPREGHCRHVRSSRRLLIAIAVAAAGATFLSAAELGSLNRALEESRMVEGPRVMAREARQTISDFNARPPIDGWLASGDQQRELKQLTRYVRDCTRPDDRLLVTWFAPEVYFYSERKFAAGLAFFYQGFFVSPAGEESSAGAPAFTARPDCARRGLDLRAVFRSRPSAACCLPRRAIRRGWRSHRPEGILPCARRSARDPVAHRRRRGRCRVLRKCVRRFSDQPLPRSPWPYFLEMDRESAVKLLH